ncbi:ClpXP protease specificity-enhancing factor [Variovorax sp. RHLX14]|uniref:ClpXP protease specificity-enhancing factor n=1 Tax=Variovorax sp. RHLX14 TaxID=1259731 RepID=UPI003F46EDC2
MTDTQQPTSTRPYLIRALYEWCTDNGFTPYVAVQVDHTVQVPREFVKNGEIVLDISFGATSSLKLDNEFIAFKARFGGIAREIIVPIGRVVAIYASENGEGMAFPPPIEAEDDIVDADADTDGNGEQADLASGAGSPGIALAKEPQQRSPLRDALRGAESEGNKVIHLVSTDSEDSDTDSSHDGSSEPPRPPSPNGGAKPSLKRVK